MLKLNTRSLIGLSGLVWLMISILLISRGVQGILDGCKGESGSLSSFTAFFSRTIRDPSHIAVLFVAFSLFIGHLKGKYLLTKTMQKQINRLESLPATLPITKLYNRASLILIGCMMLLGIVMRLLPIPSEIRGIVQTAVGMALLQGALHAFRHLLRSMTTANAPK